MPPGMKLRVLCLLLFGLVTRGGPVSSLKFETFPDSDRTFDAGISPLAESRENNAGPNIEPASEYDVAVGFNSAPGMDSSKQQHQGQESMMADHFVPFQRATCFKCERRVCYRLYRICHGYAPSRYKARVWKCLPFSLKARCKLTAKVNKKKLLTCKKKKIKQSICKKSLLGKARLKCYETYKAAFKKRIGKLKQHCLAGFTRCLKKLSYLKWSKPVCAGLKKRCLYIGRIHFLRKFRKCHFEFVWKKFYSRYACGVQRRYYLCRKCKIRKC